MRVQTWEVGGGRWMAAVERNGVELATCDEPRWTEQAAKLGALEALEKRAHECLEYAREQRKELR